MKRKGGRITGIGAALASALFLGLAPIFGKQAITLGFSPLAVVALRTSMAAGILLILLALFRRPFLYIYPAGLLGCGLAGTLNGIGSILYYMALERLDVSVGQLLYSLYPIFLVIWMLIDHQSPGKLTYLRMAAALLGAGLLTLSGAVTIDWIGVCLMLGASVMYALHLPVNQRVLYDIPAPTVTMYTLLAMSAVTVPAYFLFDRNLPPTGVSWTPILMLTLVTFFSRLTLFLGLKRLGGIQTALLGLSELFVAIIFSHIWLHEVMTPFQWTGAAFLGISLLLIAFEKIKPETRKVSGLLGWIQPPSIPRDITWGPHE